MSTLKRFRPSTELICSHVHCIEPASSVSCAHCPLTFCLQHLVEHQIAIDKENKYLISAIENCRTHLKTLQFNDNRFELFQQLNQWQKTMIENVEMMKKEIYLTYEQYDQEFNRIKKTMLNNDNDNEKSLKEIFNHLKQSLKTLESSHLELIISKLNPTIHLIKPNFNSLLFNSQITIRPNLDQFLLLSKIVFTLDYDPIDITYFITSPQYLIIYKSSRSIFQLFNNIGEHLCDINYDHINYGDLNQLIWSSYVNGFLLATSKQLLKLNCTTKRITRYIDIGFGFFKDICTCDESILLVHNLGTSLGDVIEHYSNNQMIQRCWKSDLYVDEIHMKETMEIFRIRISNHLVAIDALFTDKILICDISRAMKCLFRIDTKQYNILSISPVYDTQQWLLFVTDEQNEYLQQRIFVIDAQENDDQRRMRELKCNGLLPTNICFFGSNHFIITRTENKEEEKFLFECRKMHNIF
ncbi:unnamed protein product [Rotaria sordida]|uniref:Uncharacterized protein n=1 Tax=Rotaria sordida TaxID=392033 RepID=A0A814XLK9_9BILA|nr:unnamed protein product [Rotaria sordida]